MVKNVIHFIIFCLIISPASLQVLLLSWRYMHTSSSASHWSNLTTEFYWTQLRSWKESYSFVRGAIPKCCSCQLALILFSYLFSWLDCSCSLLPSCSDSSALARCHRSSSSRTAGWTLSLIFSAPGSLSAPVWSPVEATRRPFSSRHRSKKSSFARI